MNPKDQIKENLSITDVVTTYIRLEKSGSQFRARCPFHNEKTPSFYVSPERKSFHCFGCQAHGDIFTFVEKIENIPFFDALKILADRAGIQLTNTEKNKEDMRLVSLLKDATIHFENNLKNSPESKNYLLERGLTEETISTFHIGFAKNEWRDLFMYLASKGYSPEEMEQSGITIEAKDSSGKTKGWYDRFRGRIMFPIRNVSGATVGYSGRILPSFVDATVAQGKYVNTPETALYHKSKILFGYDTAKKKMSESKAVVIVEGQMDLCMSYQAGVTNTVAVSGTAFTDEHINLIKRFCDTVILSFDQDKAGEAALKKTAMLCLLGGLDVYVISIGSKDPADLIKESKEDWLKAIENKKHIVENVLNDILKSEKDQRIRGQRIVSELLPFIRAIQSPIDRAHFLRVIEEKANIPQSVLMEELSRGSFHQAEVIKEITSPVPLKDRIARELIAYATLTSKLNDESLLSLSLDLEQFPEAIIQEEMFKLEEKAVGNKDKYFTDLISTYKKELHKQSLLELQQKLQEEGHDEDEILQKIYIHMKNNGG
ncbi:MAG: dnaG [Candidatus Nomurabacteria bacterium]|nr:dnaG [Candidatus Nomurabacteria bacterium]